MTTEPPLRDRIPDLPEAARALLLAADIVESGDLHEVVLPREQVERFQDDEEAMLRTIIGHVLRQLAAGGLPTNVTRFDDVHLPRHLHRPLYAIGDEVRSAGSNDVGEVTARTYDFQRGWLYYAQREGIEWGGPWTEEAGLLPKGADLPPGILWVEDCPECTPADPTVTFSQRNRCNTCESGKVYLPEPSNPAVKSALWALGEVKVAKAVALARNLFPHTALAWWVQPRREFQAPAERLAQVPKFQSPIARARLAEVASARMFLGGLPEAVISELVAEHAYDASDAVALAELGVYALRRGGTRGAKRVPVEILCVPGKAA